LNREGLTDPPPFGYHAIDRLENGDISTFVELLEGCGNVKDQRNIRKKKHRK
jgi:hypothetical protein